MDHGITFCNEIMHNFSTKIELEHAIHIYEALGTSCTYAAVALRSVHDGITYFLTLKPVFVLDWVETAHVPA